MAADLQGGAGGGAPPRRGPNRELEASPLGLLGHSLSFLFAPGRFWVTGIYISSNIGLESNSELEPT